MIPHHHIGARCTGLMSVIASVVSISKGCTTLSDKPSDHSVSSPLTKGCGGMKNSESLNEVSVSVCASCTLPSCRTVESTSVRSTISMPSISISP